jgi:hypothetical protein
VTTARFPVSSRSIAGSCHAATQDFGSFGSISPASLLLAPGPPYGRLAGDEVAALAYSYKVG